MLTTDALRRLKAITDVFEEIDGISYEQAVAISELDANPESDIAIYEEMVRVYNNYCCSRLLKHEERKEVYKVLLLRTFCDEQEAINRIDVQSLEYERAVQIIRQYSLEPKPLVLYYD